MPEMKKCGNKNHKGDPLLPATTEYFYNDASSSDNLSSWCQVCQKDRYQPKSKPGDMNSADFMMDGQGRYVHVDTIEEIDMLRNSLVLDIVARAKALQTDMRAFKEYAMAEINAFSDLSAREYKAPIGGKKGNINLPAFDTRAKVQIQISEFLIFDERLQVAKKLVDECLNKWAEDSRPEIRTIINDAFAVDQEGKINTGRILSLRRLKIDDPSWQKAMKAISDSLQVSGSKSYIRIYERTGLQDAWNRVALDMAAI